MNLFLTKRLKSSRSDGLSLISWWAQLLGKWRTSPAAAGEIIGRRSNQFFGTIRDHALGTNETWSVRWIYLLSFYCIEEGRITTRQRSLLLFGDRIYSIPCRDSYSALGGYEEYCRMNCTMMSWRNSSINSKSSLNKIASAVSYLPRSLTMQAVS